MTDPERLEEIIGAWHDARDRGIPLDPEAVIERHPDLTEELRRHFAAMDVLDQVLCTPGPRSVSIPTKMGPYRLQREIGAGGMGTVFQARVDETDGVGEIGTTVAVKVVHPHLLAAQGFFHRFHREAEIGRRVLHPNVVRALDFDVEVVDEVPLCYLVMEFVEGHTLRELLHDLGTVPESLIREIGRQIAEGLAAIHAEGAVHRDLKPENVLITKDHEIRIMDLGVAHLSDASQAITLEGQFAGSLAYAAPEQFEGVDVGPEADLYALGVLLHELATGVNPFRHDELGAVVHAHLHEIPPRITDAVPDLTPFLAELVASLLAKAAVDRPSPAATLAGIFTEGESSSWWAEREVELRQHVSRIPRVPVRRETKLHGRDEDLAQLEHAWVDAQRGEGNTLLLEGEAGIGKSRIVDAFLEGIDGQKAQVLYGSCARSGGSGGISDAVLGRFGREDLETVLQPYLAVTPTLVPALAALLRREPLRQDAPPLQGDPLQAVFVHLMRALADESPLVWVIEDLHFADADTRQLVHSLARAVEGHPILLLLTTRPTLAAEDLALLNRLENFERRTLSRLGARDVIELLQDAFKSERLAEKLGGKIALKSDGVPFFVFEMIRGLREGQFITQLPDGSWVESEVIEDIEIPDTVRELIEARLRGRSDDERAILDVGAVQGFEFDPDLVARALNRPPVHVLQSVAAMERRSGVVFAHGRDVCFDHHQIQEVLYESLMPALREEYHSLLARALAEREDICPDAPSDVHGETAVFLASHGLLGHEPKDGRPYLERALDHLAATYRHDEAIVLADRALGQPGLLAGTRRFKVLLHKNRRLDMRLRRSDQKEVLARARVLAEASGEKSLTAATEYAAGVLNFNVDDYEKAKQCFEGCLTIAREIGDQNLATDATRGLASALACLGRIEEVQKHAESSLAIAREIGDRESEGFALSSIGVSLERLGRRKEAQPYFERSLVIARETGDRRREGNRALNLGIVLNSLGRRNEARDSLECALAAGREIGDRRMELGALMELGCLHHAVARHVEAQECFERGLVITRECQTGTRIDRALLFGNLGVVLTGTHRYEEAQAYLDKALSISRELGRKDLEAEQLGHLGVLLYGRGRREEACDYYEQRLAIARDNGYRDSEAGAALHIGALLIDFGHYAEAREYLERALTVARELDSRTHELEATNRMGLWLAGLGCYEEAREHTKSALTGLREIGKRSREAFCLCCLASIEEAAGEADEARSLYADALALYGELCDPSGEASACLGLGRLDAACGRTGAARESLEEATTKGRKLDKAGVVVPAECHLALLPNGDVARALSDMEEHEQRLAHHEKVESRLLLWRCTNEAAHLTEAKRLLDYHVEHAPEEYRESMLKNVRLHREIMQAWAEHGDASTA